MEKYIHQIWYQGRSNLPQKYEIPSLSWQHMNPDYDYKFWDAETINELVRNNYPAFFERWNAIESIIKRCDAARCFILHAYGGVYADFDTTCVRPIDGFVRSQSLQNTSVILSLESRAPLAWKSAISSRLRQIEPDLPIVGNAIMLSKKLEPFWLDFLAASFEKADCVVLESFSTWHLSRFVFQDNYTTVRIVSDRYLMSPTFLPNVSYALHSYDANWFDHSLAEPWCFA
jgi:hypothetical protein